MPEETMTYTEAAEYLGIHVNHIGAVLRSAGLQWSNHVSDQRKKLVKVSDLRRIRDARAVPAMPSPRDGGDA